MKKLRWQLIIIFLTGLVVGILLLSEQPGAITPIEPEPVKGGSYTEALIGSLQRLNPLLDFYNPVDRDVNRLIFSGLVRFDARGMPQKDLAESWGFTKDGTVYTFALRPNLLWHDGEPLTTNDIVFTIEKLSEGEGVIPEDLRSFWEDVEVNAINETTIQFKLPEPFAPFLDYLTFGILPQHLLGQMDFNQVLDSDFNLQPVGSGPYRFDRLIVEEGEITGVVLSSFPEYYDEPAYIDQVIFRYYSDSEAALIAYQDGEVQGIGQVTPDVLPDILAEQNLAVYTGRRPELSLVIFNLKNPTTPFLGDMVVRQALMTGLNRQWIIDRILQGQAIMANGVIFPGTWAYYDGLESVSYDLEKAVTMLKDAGYVIAAEGDVVREKDGEALSFELLHPDDELHTIIAESIQNDWAKLGVEVTLAAMPYDQLINERLANREFSAALVDLNLSRSPDPDPYPFWDQAQATGGQNYSQWDNRIASEYLEQARVTSDVIDRSKLYRNFQVVFNDELPALPLYYPVYTYAVDRQVQGVQMGPLYDTSDRFLTVNQWFLLAGRTVQVTSTAPAGQ